MWCKTTSVWEGTTIHLSYVCMWLLAALPRWTTCAISSVVPKGDILSQVCYHHATIVSSCTFFEPTIRQQSGSAVCKVVPHCRTLPSVDGNLAIHWMRSPPAPYAVLEWLACKCIRSCKLPKCACMANGLACTCVCKLQSCCNQKQQAYVDDIVELGDSDDDIDEQVDVWLLCLINMSERSYTMLRTRSCSTPAEIRNRKKRTASNSVI